MSVADAFRMQGARAVLASLGDGLQLERRIEALEKAVDEDPGMAFDLAKSLVETICKTILADRGQEELRNPRLPDLLNATITCVPLIPNRPSESENPSAASLRSAVGGLNRVVSALAELRNSEGATSHGRDAFADSLDPLHARLAAQSADAVVYFLYNAHRADITDIGIKRLRYDEELAFNEYIDQVNEGIWLFEQRLQASLILFKVDYDEYCSRKERYVSLGLTSEQLAREEALHRQFDDYFDDREGEVIISGQAYRPSEILRRLDRDSYEEAFRQYLDELAATTEVE